MKWNVPRLAGASLRLARTAAESRSASAVVRQILKGQLGVDELADLPEGVRGALPLDYRPIRARNETRPLTGNLPIPKRSGWPRTTTDYHAVFAQRRASPRQIVERAIRELARLRERKPTMNVLASSLPDRALADAEASSRRYEAGQALGPLDGVPFLVKDQHDAIGLPTSLGARGTRPVALRDATLVSRLRAAGAVLLGKTVLTEWGLSPIGANVHFEMPHNAFDPTRAAGGSSTGSAVGVALGLCPFATGGDGGGSIRIPASLNGIFGIKPTFGRVSRAGDGFRESVAALGPLGASTADLALFLDAVAASHDPDDECTELAPPPPSGGFVRSLMADVRGISIGIDEREWRDASPEIQAAGQGALRSLERSGAVLRPVEVSLASNAARIGFLSIGSESLVYQGVGWETRRGDLADDLRLSFAALSGVTAFEYLDAQRLRRALTLEVAAALRAVDVLALPCTAAGAPRYDERDAAGAFSDPGALSSLCRFSFLANLTGLPAAAAPVGTDELGLPTGLQLVGDAWAEPTLLALLAELERAGVARARRPPHAIDLLESVAAPV